MVGTLERAFSGRNVFVTGHTGFKGSWLALWLKRLGAKVHGYSLDPPTQPNNFQAARVREILATDQRGDIRDGDRLERALKAAEAEVLFHLAAQALVRESYAAPRETFDVNVLGTVNVLEAVRDLRRPCVAIVVTSDKCYENREQAAGYREGDPLGGFDPYSASKGAAEIATAAYRRSFFSPDQVAEHGVKVASVRAGNVIGGGDWGGNRIVTDIVTALASGRPVPVRNPQAVRPWQHVLEPLSGYLALAAKMLESPDAKWCGAWNFGPTGDEDARVAELVERFCRTWGSGSWEHRSGGAAPHEAQMLRLDIGKAVAQLGWRPRWRLAETIERTARWYRQFYAKPASDMRQACLDDIAAYAGQTSI